jgi:hypothetical protein
LEDRIMLSHSFTYESALADALKVNWRVEDLIGGDKTLDFGRPFLPEALAGVQSIGCLDAREKLVLNQIRGNSYLYLFGFVEEFILPFVLDQARTVVHDDPYELRALLAFADEEAKHMHLFRAFADQFKRGFKTRCDCIGPAREIAAAILKHSALGVILVTLHLEWMTQRHYLGSVKDTEEIDPQFASLLRHHWMEESQHAKIDTLMTDKIASTLDAAGIQKGFDDYLAIGTMLDGGLSAQVGLDLEALSRALGRTFTDAEKAEITGAQGKSYRWTFLVSGMTHPNFTKTIGELSAAGAARVAEVAKALS